MTTVAINQALILGLAALFAPLSLLWAYALYDSLRSALLGAGLPADYTDFMLLILGYFKAGYSERTTNAVQQITGRAPRTLAQYAADHRSAWQA